MNIKRWICIFFLFVMSLVLSILCDKLKLVKKNYFPRISQNCLSVEKEVHSDTFKFLFCSSVKIFIGTDLSLGAETIIGLPFLRIFCPHAILFCVWDKTAIPPELFSWCF